LKRHSLVDRIADLLESSDQGLAVREIAVQLGVDAALVDSVVWSSPNRFSWQPGHRWVLAPLRPVQAPPAVRPGQSDSRPLAFVPEDSTALRAVALAGGGQLVVRKRPLDGTALFAARSRGSEIELVMNSAHPVFAELPMPFEAEDKNESGYKQLLELVLEAIALYEDGLVADKEREHARAARISWGRKLRELTDDF
jgi:hypothetical protein